VKIKDTGRVGYVNGRWVAESELVAHTYTYHYMYGLSCFDMLRTFSHEIFLADEHIDRLFSSMSSLYIPNDQTHSSIKAIMDELISRNPLPENEEYRILINVDKGPLSIYRDVFELEEGEEWDTPTWQISAWPLSKVARTLAHFYKTGANAVTTSQRQIPSQYLDPKIKSRSRAHLQIANVEASKLGADAMALLLDDHGFVCEGTGSNFMMVKDGAIVIPERRNMLRGCSMMYIIDVLSKQLGISIIEKNIEPYDVLNADEAFFTGTFNNILPCNRFNGQVIKGMKSSSGPMGDMTKVICDKWAENVGVDFIKQLVDWQREHELNERAG